MGATEAEAGHRRRTAEKVTQKERPTRRGIAFWLVAGDGSVLLRRRPERGLLGGSMEIPSTDWKEGEWPEDEPAGAFLFRAPTGSR